MPQTKDREYRNMTFEVREDGAEPSFLVEGYASTFEPYKLIEIDGEERTAIKLIVETRK